VSAAAAHAAAASIARSRRAVLVAKLAARTRDAAGAEDALADAFATALVEWPARGVPRAPEAWLATVATRRWIDARRRRRTEADAAPHLRLLAEERASRAVTHERVGDERVALLFAGAHPAIDEAARVPLLLQTIFRLDAAAIAAVFGVSPAAMSQRLVRAKARLRAARIPCEVPERCESRARLATVLEAIGAAFAASDANVELAADCVRLARGVARFLPDEPAPRRLAARLRYALRRRRARSAVSTSEAHAALRLDAASGAAMRKPTS
jgi:RNA polymerase sigma-70 factor (ECF subfamily)